MGFFHNAVVAEQFAQRGMSSDSLLADVARAPFFIHPMKGVPLFGNMPCLEDELLSFGPDVAVGNVLADITG